MTGPFIQKINDSIRVRPSIFIYHLGLMIFSVWFFGTSDHTFTALIFTLLFISFTELAGMKPPGSIARIVLSFLGMAAILSGVYLHTVKSVNLIGLGFYIPFFAQYLFRDFIFSNLTGIFVALVFYFREAYGSFEVTVSNMIGVISVTILYSVIFFLIKKVTLERDRYRELSLTDSLTGMFNLPNTLETGQKMLNKGMRVTVLVIDLDHFKEINDTYGHLVGNRALQYFAGLLKKGTEGLDHILGRLGGDEFIILFHGLTPQEEALQIKHLHDTLRNNPFFADPDIAPITLSCSIGAENSFNQPGASIDKLLNTADIRMYENKYESYLADAGPVIKNSELPGRCGEIFNTLKEKDIYTYIHSQYVAAYAGMIGRYMGLPEETVKDLCTAGWLHDLGKLFVSSDILRKPAGLTDKEYSTIKKHVNDGVLLLDIFEVSDTVKNAVKYHHERWDGKGYPYGLTGGETPLEGRIMQIADVFSAITIKRVYRARMTLDEALEEIEKYSASQFDPIIINIFISNYKREKAAAVKEEALPFSGQPAVGSSQPAEAAE